MTDRARPPHRPRGTGGNTGLALVRTLLLGTAAGALALASSGALAPAHAQSRGPSIGTGLEAPRLQAGKEMLVTADELQYDYQNDRVSAVGHVQIYNDGSVLEADRVIYDRRANKMYGEGNVRLKSKSGDVVYAERLELSQDFKQGFVDSLRLEGADRTHFAAARADRRDGDVLVLRSGVYTACEPCKEDPKKPVAWQVKAARIIHKEGERMVYYENATIEMFGFPVAWFPYFSHPDPTVKRKSGFLMPEFAQSTKFGFSAGVPYYWALAPDYDVTLTPTITTKQGVLMQGEWRQRLINGAYTIRAAGIHQEDLSVFVRTDGSTTPGYREDRGMIEFARRILAERALAVGLGRRHAVGQDVPAGLRPEQAHGVLLRPEGNPLAGLHHRHRRPQLLRRPLGLLHGPVGVRRCRSSFRSPTRSSTTTTSSCRRCGAARPGSTSTSPACRAPRPTSTASTAMTARRCRPTSAATTA